VMFATLLEPGDVRSSRVRLAGLSVASAPPDSTTVPLEKPEPEFQGGGSSAGGEGVGGEAPCYSVAIVLW
jgi:hypothetical protein